MKPMQVRIDDIEIIPNIIKVTATYAEPDTSELIGPTVEIVMHLEKRSSDYKQIYRDAVRQAECILKDILEID